MKKLILVSIILLGLYSCKSAKNVVSKEDISEFKALAQPDLITIKDGKFYKGESPYYYVGTNYWYGPLLASQGEEGKLRLNKELDFMLAHGIDNLRVLIGADGGKNDYTVKPALQYKLGKYDDKLLEGLDYFMAALRKRNMYAVLYFTNNWEWSGGMSQYLEWNGYGKVPIPNLQKYTWKQYFDYFPQFHSCKPCMEQLEDHVRFIMGRTNRYTNKKYTTDNTVMSWQVGNEPRIANEAHEKPFTEWLNRVVDLIEELDPVHLISTGAEGEVAFLDDIDSYKRIHKNSNIDYLTAHVWVKNWSLYKEGEPGKGIEDAKIKAKAYVQKHINVAKEKGVPLVFSEFGLPRQGESLSVNSSVKNRDNYYQMIFSMLEDNYENGGALNGLNFWGFSGFAQPKNRNSEGKWEKGDDLTSDPPQEPQGLNSVFASDTSTMNLIKSTNKKLGNLNE